MANTPPSKAPTVPAVFGTPTTISITVRFVISNITGKPPPTYSILYGTTTNPTTVGIATPVPKSKTTYQAVINGLTANTTYYIKSVAKNSVGIKSSSSAIIKTAGALSSPSKAPTVPVVFGTPTLTSITKRFNVVGITGNPTPTYSILYGTTTNPTTVGSATLVSGTLYQSILNNLKQNTTYYIKSVAKNSVGIKSSSSAIIKTAAPLSLPSKAPTVPVAFFTPTSTSITTRFDTNGITGNPRPTYSILYGTTTNPTTVGNATFVNGTIYQVVLNGLTSSTTYYIKSVAKNSVGSKTSASAIIRTALGVSSPSKAPTVPVVFGLPTTTSITTRFDVAGITGNPPPTYSILYGTTTDPTTVGTATLVNGTIYEAVINGLTSNTAYYIKSVATNPVDSKTSSFAVINTAISPPSKAPTDPLVFGNPTTTSITIRFDVADITGNPPPTYSILYGTTTLPTTVGTATLVNGTIYEAVINGLTSNTAYYIKSVATNSAGDKTSPFAVINTAISPPSKAPTIPVVFGTPTLTSITTRFDVVDITGDLPITYSILYGTTTNPTTVGSATLVNGTIYEAVINGLTSNTEYYIKSVATNFAGNKGSEPLIIITDPPSKAPTVPTMFNATTTSISLEFDVANINSGSVPLSFFIITATSLDSSATTLETPATLYNGTIYRATISELNEDTNYYFKSVARNSFGDKRSQAIINTPFQPVLSTFPPYTPVLLASDPPRTITVYFDTKSVNGTPPLSFFVTHRDSRDPSATVYETPATLDSGTIYRAKINNTRPEWPLYVNSLVRSFPGDVSSQREEIETISNIPEFLKPIVSINSIYPGNPPDAFTVYELTITNRNEDKRGYLIITTSVGRELYTPLRWPTTTTTINYKKPKNQSETLIFYYEYLGAKSIPSDPIVMSN